ncbi:MAG: metallo-mystery pair system four-Cys motif protein [Bryobacterales bacterium]|nr:metallo-mystery pair system four-Cys motif protein [Bryobacterales bacterium]
MTRCLVLAVFALTLAASLGASQPVSIRFAAQVGDRPLACGAEYPGIGSTGSTIRPRDFRFYVSNLRLVDQQGNETPVELEQDGLWQLDDVALLDFEDATAGCSNGTPQTNTTVRGAVPEGNYVGLRFELGIPFHKNHLDVTAQPSPLNLTALYWAWNSGHKFARLDFSSTGQPRGFAIHLGSTGCTPGDTSSTIPTACANLNRPAVEIAGFQVDRDVVVADLAALLRHANVDIRGERFAGCMSGPADPNCAPLFQAWGLPFGDAPAGEQSFFRKVSPGVARDQESAVVQ